MSTMASVPGFGPAPKKKITTYGKASKRNTLRRAESSPATIKSHRPVVDIYDIPVDEPSKSRVEPPSRKSTPERAIVARARPSPLKTFKTESDISRAKKRKVETASSTGAEETEAIWSPPSSPPLKDRKPIPKPSTRGYGSGPALSQTSSIRASRAAETLVENVEETDAPFSAKTARNLRGLSIDNGAPAQVQSIPLRLNRAQPSPSFGAILKASEPASRGDKSAQQAAGSRPRKRLIDALAAQVEESSESSEEEKHGSSQDIVSSIPNSPPLLGLRTSPPPLAEPTRRMTLQRQTSMAKKPGPRFTYSQQRTMLAEDSMLELPGLGDLGEESQARPSFLGLGSQSQPSQMSAFSFDDADDETGNTGAVRGLHELRQSGANIRTSDQMGDIFERVGAPSPKPSSIRRGALLELAQKMKAQSFRRQFRNHGGGGNLFSGLAKETDPIAGYAIIAILVTLLATSPSQHLIQQLQPEELASLLLLLLEQTADIAIIAKDRKSNVSKNAQTTLATVKTAILDLPTWEPMSPTVLSPRTLALKAMSLLTQHGVSDTELLSPRLTDRLFSIISGHANPVCWDFPSQPESIDFYLALTLLEQHSVTAMQSTTGSRWNSEYLPTVADILGVALQRPADKFDDLEKLVLRLTLNTTNNNQEAGRMFVDRGLLRQLAEAACRTFDVVLKSIMDDAFMSKVLDSLILMLGVGINFCEHFPPAAQNLVNSEAGETTTLDKLIRVFLDYHATTAEVSIYPDFRDHQKMLTDNRLTRWKRPNLMSPSATIPSYWGTSVYTPLFEKDSCLSIQREVSNHC